MTSHSFTLLFFFFNDTATTEIYTLSLHDALPICFYTKNAQPPYSVEVTDNFYEWLAKSDFSKIGKSVDRKSTRLNSSHANISYAVFCLKKKKNKYQHNSYVLHINVITVFRSIYTI